MFTTEESQIDEMTPDDIWNIQNIDLKEDLVGFEVQFEGLDSTVITELEEEYWKGAR